MSLSLLNLIIKVRNCQKLKMIHTDLLVRSHLLQALMNETGVTNKPQSLPPDESLVTKPGCRNTGNFPSEESKIIWLNFKDTLETYATFHHEQFQSLRLVIALLKH